MKAVIILLAFIGAALAENDFGNICYQCNEFNPQGQGFMAHPDECCFYFECWRVRGSDAINQIRRNCPPGTWWNPEHGADGIPCIDEKPDPTCADTCGPGVVEQTWECPYHAYQADSNKFGHDSAIPLWTCVPGAVFDEKSCTCIHTGACFCLADLPLTSNIEDDSCTRGAIVSSGSPVVFHSVPPLIDSSVIPGGHAGYFSGSGGETHLNAQVFSGLFTPCGRGCLSVGLFFNSANAIPLQGLVSYGSCDPKGASWQITIENNQIRTTIGSDTLSVWFNEGQWYYYAFVFKQRTGKFRIYLTSVAGAIACATNCQCPPPSNSMVITKDCPIEPRACGLEIGHTGTQANSTQFFQGDLARVQVSTKCNMMGCETASCMLKGKRRTFKYPW